MYTYILHSLNDLDNICRKKKEYDNSLRVFHKTFKTTNFYVYVYQSKRINKTEIRRFDKLGGCRLCDKWDVAHCICRPSFTGE